MKCITYVRHAKSSWSDLGLSDFERPLNKRGKRDAPFMANKWKTEFVIPQLLISSPAKRALQTSLKFKDAFGLKTLHKESSLYHADEDELENVIYIPDNNIDHIMVFAHNPGLTYLANKYSKSYIDNIPTCGMFSLNSTEAEWSTFFNKAMLSLFIYPKKYL